jgi:hypothetical protein
MFTICVHNSQNAGTGYNFFASNMFILYNTFVL